MVRYPLGGMISWVVQYITGFLKLGHEVYFVEKYGYPNSCFNPITHTMSDDCHHGLKVVSNLLRRFGLGDNWCFVARDGRYHGLSKNQIETVFKTADLFIDMGTHGSWMEEAQHASLRILLDGEPGYTQIRMVTDPSQTAHNLCYDLYYTNGLNIGTDRCSAPDGNITWGHLPHPVDTDIIKFSPPRKNGAFSTIMNWRSHDTVDYNGRSFGQKDMEFIKIITLPGLVGVKMEVAVSGKKIPYELLRSHSWHLRDGLEVTKSYDSFIEYLTSCRGEFSVCKQVFVATRTAWFSDKSGAFLALGRPVVLQNTGFSDHLPCGKGLFAFENIEQARDALENISTDHLKHSHAARELACEYLEARKVLGKFLTEIGL